MSKLILSEEEKERIVSFVLDKLRKDKKYSELVKDLLKEYNPIEVDKIFRKFIDINKIDSTQEKYNLFAFLKTEGVLKEHVKREGLHNVWIKLRNEFAPKASLEN